MSRRIAALAMMLTLVFANFSNAGTVELWREAVVTGDDVHLGDLCRVAGFDSVEAKTLNELVVAVAPIPGGSVVYTGAELRHALADQGINLATLIVKGAATCSIKRPVATAIQDTPKFASPQRFAVEDGVATEKRCLRYIIEQFFQSEISRSQAKVHLRFGRANAEALDLCEPRFSFRLERTSGRSLGMVGLKVTVFEDGEVVQEFPLLVEVSMSADVLVAARSVNVGAILNATDVRVVEMAFERSELVGANDPQAVIGRRAKRFIPEGSQVRTQDLEIVPLVKRGQLVDVYSNVGGVSIVTAAQALEDGTIGDIVALRADGHSRSRFSATVSGQGRVRIGGGEALAMGGE